MLKESWRFNQFLFIALGTSVSLTILEVNSVQAAQLLVPNTTVLGTNVFSGPSFVVSGDFSPSDTLSLTTSGTVDLASGRFTANAAGIIIAPATTNTGSTPGQTATGPRRLPYASLLIGNDSLGFFSLFPANAANGLGSTTPPTTLSLANVPLSSIFTNASFTGLSNGTTLEFRVNDVNMNDNSGLFTIAEAIPEPLTMLGIGTALGFGIFFKRKLAKKYNLQ